MKLQIIILHRLLGVLPDEFDGLISCYFQLLNVFLGIGSH